MKNLFSLLLVLIITLFFISSSQAETKENVMYFYIGHLENGYKINVKNNEILYRKLNGSENNLEWETIKTDETKIKKFTETLKAIGIKKWEKRYEDNTVADGTQYEIYIQCDVLKISITGNNKYPEKFKEYLKAVKDFTGKKEFN